MEGFWKEPDVWTHGAGPVKNCIREFRHVQTIEDLVVRLDDLVQLATKINRGLGPGYKVLHWVARLWAHGLVAMPLSLWKCGSNRFEDTLLQIEQFSWLKDCDIAALCRTPEERVVARLQTLKIASLTQGIRELGDLTPKTINSEVIARLDYRAPATITRIIRMQVQRYGEQFRTVPADWAHLNHRVRKGDAEFKWVLDIDPRLEPWREALAAWGKPRNSLNTTLQFGNAFLNYLLANPAVTRNPVEFCHRAYIHPKSFVEHLSTQQVARVTFQGHNNAAFEFFEWFMDTRLSAPDDYGRPARSPEHWNPIPARQNVSGKPLQTCRDALPIRYINELINIITEHDFAWPKKFKGDYIKRMEPESGKSKRIWCPVRASLLLLKLFLPLRTFQIRVLDSGEMDTERYEGGEWVPNPSQLAPKTGAPVAKGCLRKFVDKPSGQVYTGFFVNTNKTADRLKDAEDRGYEIPWQHQRAIDVIVSLREWQERFNAIAGPASWASLHCHKILTSRRPELRRRLNNCFLFRDPCGTHFNEPVSDMRVRTFWRSLMVELERRVAARGETLLSGSPISFVEWKGNRALPIYDLHTLRVSLLTALATEGGVPLNILSKCVAGHASILMTLYYVKLNAAYVTEQLGEAQKKVSAAEQKNFMQFLQEASYREIEGSAISNDADGLVSLKGTQPGSWVVGDLGICPVGCSMCHKGGPKTSSTGRINDHAPTPGGSGNCVRCRFFVTGPAFLGGLVAHFNANTVKLMDCAARFRARQSEIQKLEDAQLEAERESRNFSQLADLNLAYERLSQCSMELDEIAHNSHATYALVERCRGLLKQKQEQGSGMELSLVLAGQLTDLDVAVRTTTDFEVFNAVCQVAKIYPNEESSIANLKRSRIIDGMLALNGRRPVFALLSETEALAVGNEYTSFLLARAGRENTLAVMEGKKLLRDCGIADEADRLLEDRTGAPVHLSNVIKIPTTQKQLN